MAILSCNIFFVDKNNSCTDMDQSQIAHTP